MKRRLVAPFALLLLAATVAPDPSLPDAAVVAAIVATCLGLSVKTDS